jgi:hypothetical protein
VKGQCFAPPDRRGDPYQNKITFSLGNKHSCAGYMRLRDVSCTTDRRVVYSWHWAMIIHFDLLGARVSRCVRSTLKAETCFHILATHACTTSSSRDGDYAGAQHLRLLLLLTSSF